MEDAGADAITCGSGLPAWAMDAVGGEPILGEKGEAMLSGPAVRPVILRAVSELAARVSIPIVGCGGVTDLDDALAYFAAGAQAVQIGTAMLADPSLPARLGADYQAHLVDRAWHGPGWPTG